MQLFFRNFDLRLVRDNTVFHPDAVIETAEEEIPAKDISHIYHGQLHGMLNMVS